MNQLITKEDTDGSTQRRIQNLVKTSKIESFCGKVIVSIFVEKLHVYERFQVHNPPFSVNYKRKIIHSFSHL